VARFQADRELRCDARVLELLAPSERFAYGHTLLRIQETFLAPPAAAGLAPCVRNHPSLQQRLTMITHPSIRQPWLQSALALTLGVLTCYSFTTARAERDPEIPTKERSPEGERAATSDRSDPSEESAEKRSPRERDGDVKKPGLRDGEVRKTGPRDGEGKTMVEREGERRKTFAPEGEGKVKPGPRDGEVSKKVGPRDGEARVKKPLLPPGERPVKKPALPEGEGPVKKLGESINLRVIKGGEAVMVGDEEVEANTLRAYLSKFLPQHPGANVSVTADTDVPHGRVLDTLDAARDNGAKHARIAVEQ